MPRTKSAKVWHPHPEYLAGLKLHDAGDMRGAVKAYRKGAEDGDSTSQYVLANILDDQNKPREAVYWYKRSVKQGDPIGTYNLAIYYGNRGRFQWLLYWLRVAEKLGEEDVAGQAFERAEYLRDKKEMKKAIGYFKAAAEMGDVAAQCNLGVVLETEIKPSRVKEALYWYRRSARSGSAVGAANLAWYYRDVGKPRSQLHWLGVAEKLGDKKAARWIRQLERQLERKRRKA
jgi:TPR repeat protein